VTLWAACLFSFEVAGRAVGRFARVLTQSFAGESYALRERLLSSATFQLLHA